MFIINPVIISLIVLAAFVLIGVGIILTAKSTSEAYTKSEDSSKKTEYEVWFKRKKDLMPSRYHIPVELLVGLAKKASIRQKTMNYILVSTGFENVHTKGSDNVFERSVEIMQERMDSKVDDYPTENFNKIDAPYAVELIVLKEEAFIIGKHNETTFVAKDINDQRFNVYAREFVYPARANGKKPTKKDNYIAVKERIVRLEKGTRLLTLKGIVANGDLLVRDKDGRSETYPKHKLVDEKTQESPRIIPQKTTKTYYKNLLKELKNGNIITQGQMDEFLKIITNK